MKVALALIVSAFALAPSRAALDIVKIRTTAFPIMAPVYIAEAEGFFAQQGLQVQQVEMATGSAILPALIRGDIDVLPTPVIPGIFNAIVRGGRLRIVGSQMQFGGSCTHSGILVTRALASSGVLDSAEKLRGRSYALGSTLTYEYLLARILKPFNLKIDDLRALDIPDSARVEALRAGRLDLAFIGEPYLSQSLADPNYVLWKSNTALLPGFQYAVMLYGPSLLDARPEVGKRFMAAYVRGVRQFLLGKTPRNLDILVKPLNMDRTLLAQICWPPVTADSRVNVASLLDYQSWLLGRNLVDKALAPAEMLDSRFIDYANSVLAK